MINVFEYLDGVFFSDARRTNNTYGDGGGNGDGRYAAMGNGGQSDTFYGDGRGDGDDWGGIAGDGSGHGTG